MFKTEVLDTELAEIVWQRFNFPWCTGYLPKRYRRGLNLLIHKYPNDCCPRRLRPILLFDIDENMHNKHLGRISMIQAETLDGIDPEKYWSRKLKASDIQDLNTKLFYDLTEPSPVPQDLHKYP